MESSELPYDRIVFVCTNHRDKDERVCCAARDSVDLHKKLKDMVKERGLRVRVRVSKSGCMDRCELGPNVMIFPDNIWLSGVEERDLDRIADFLAGDRATL